MLPSAWQDAEEAAMSTYEYELLIRAEQNKDLERDAAFERRMSNVRPPRTSQERLGQRLVRQSLEWLESRSRTIPCEEALPACGLIPV
jgi:hypothetical protein